MLVADHNLWHQRLRAAACRSLQVCTFAAFNTNVDVVVHLSPAGLSYAIENSGASLDEVEGLTAAADLPAVVSTPTDFLVVLRAQLEEGKSYHIVVEDGLLDWIGRFFPM